MAKWLNLVERMRKKLHLFNPIALKSAIGLRGVIYFRTVDELNLKMKIVHFLSSPQKCVLGFCQSQHGMFA